MSKQSQAKIEPKEGFLVYRQRWLVLASFSFFAFLVSIPFVQYSPILDQAMIFYGVDSYDKVIWLSNIYYIDYIVFSVPLIKPIQNYLGPIIIVASLLFFGGSCLVFIFTRHYEVVIGVYIINGIVQIVQMNVPVYIAERWFPPNERTLATSIGTLVMYLGLNYGFIFPASYVTYDLSNHNLLIKQIQDIHFITMILSALAFLLCLCFVRSAPPTPPAPPNNEQKNDIRQSFLFIFSKLTSMSVFAGISWSFITIISLLLIPFNYSQTEIGIIGLSFQMTGSISGLLASFAIDNRIGKGQIPNYDFWIKLLLLISFVAMFVMSFLIKFNSLILCCFLAGTVGLGLNAYFSLACQSLVEKLFPCSELSIVTAILIVAEGFGLCSNYLVNIDFFNQYGMWVLTVLATPFMIYLMIFYKTELRRTDDLNKRIGKGNPIEVELHISNDNQDLDQAIPNPTENVGLKVQISVEEENGVLGFLPSTGRIQTTCLDPNLLSPRWTPQNNIFSNFVQ